LTGWKKSTLVALASALALHAWVAAASSPPTELVETFHQTLLGLLGADNDFHTRLARIEPAIDRAFDLEFMAGKVLGRGWKKLTPEQRSEWLDAFARLTAANYAGRFVGEAGPSFETLGEEEGAHGTRVVRTQLVDPAGKNVDLTYRLRETPDGWKIIDCYLDGTVSEIAMRRSEYGAVLRNDGFDALLAAVKRKSEQLASEPAK